MKNENRKTNKTKFLARVMLVVILLVGILNLSACEWKNIFTTTTEYVDGGYGSIVESGWIANDFTELCDSIDQNFPQGYSFVTFNFEKTEKYTVNPYFVSLKARLIANGKVENFWDTAHIESEAEINGFDNEKNILVRFISPIGKSFEFSEDTSFEIKRSNSNISATIVKDYFPKYTVSRWFGVYADDKLVMHLEIATSTIELLNEVVSSNFFEILKDYIVIWGEYPKAQ